MVKFNRKYLIRERKSRNVSFSGERREDTMGCGTCKPKKSKCGPKKTKKTAVKKKTKKKT
jgi:hypothetical protein